MARLEAVRNDPRIEVIENAMVVDLLTAAPDADGRPGPVCGVTLHVIGEGTRDGVGAALAKAVVVATGGIGQVYPSSTNPASATGDGVAAGLRAGAAIADMEFVQFHPTVLWQGAAARGQQPLISEAVRGEGAYLLNAAGERFMVGRHELAELAPRDVVSRNIVRMMEEEGSDNVFLDCRHLGADFLRERFPTIWDRLEEFDIDMAHDLIPGGARPALPLGRHPHGDSTGAPRCGGCTRWGRRRVRACTAPTVSRPTRCSRAWSSRRGRRPTPRPGGGRHADA